MFGWNRNSKTSESLKNENNGFTEEQLVQLEQLLSRKSKEKSPLEKIATVVGIIAGIVAVLGTIIGAVCAVTDFMEKFNKMQDDVTALMEDSSEMKDYLYMDGGVMDQLGNINEALELKVIVVTDESTASILDNLSVVTNDISNTATAILKDTPIGVDANGNEYVAEDLLGKVILLTYKDEGKDVFFLGKYNENYHWDGYCVTNTYNTDGTLFGICESNFDDGKRLDYKTVLCVDDTKNEWDYYSRVCNEDSNAGVSIEYYLEYEKEKNFTNTNVRYTDILYVDDFIANQDVKISQYYYGNTSNECYNDDTGKAYLITFDTDGTVRTLYVGKFVNGYPSDNSNKAWSIAYADKLGYYVHNIGKFSGGHAVDSSSEEFTQEQIDELVSQYRFGCELKWKTK